MNGQKPLDWTTLRALPVKLKLIRHFPDMNIVIRCKRVQINNQLLDGKYLDYVLPFETETHQPITMMVKTQTYVNMESNLYTTTENIYNIQAVGSLDAMLSCVRTASIF